MDGYQGQGHVNPGTRTRLGMALPGLGAFMVNVEARRFVREDVGPSELAALVLAQPGGVALEVFDQRIHEVAMRQGPYRDAWNAGRVLVAQDPASLARLANVDPEAFSRTFEAFGARLAPPLYASWVTGALAHTQGGLAVDARARVLRADGSAIEGLFAAGGAAAGLGGPRRRGLPARQRPRAVVRARAHRRGRHGRGLTPRARLRSAPRGRTSPAHACETRRSAAGLLGDGARADLARVSSARPRRRARAPTPAPCARR